LVVVELLDSTWVAAQQQQAAAVVAGHQHSVPPRSLLPLVCSGRLAQAQPLGSLQLLVPPRAQLLGQLHHRGVPLALQQQAAQQVAAPACLVAALALPQRLDSRRKVAPAPPQHSVVPLRHQPHPQLLHLASQQHSARRQLHLRHHLARPQALGKLLLLLLGSQLALGRQLHLVRLRHRRQPLVVLQLPRQHLLSGSQQRCQRSGSLVGLGVQQQVVRFLVVVVVLVASVQQLSHSSQQLRALVPLVAVPQTLLGLLLPAAHQHLVVAAVALVERRLAHHSHPSNSSSREVAVCGRCVVDYGIDWARCSVQQCRCQAMHIECKRCQLL
jgi:hypothetical protein